MPIHSNQAAEFIGFAQINIQAARSFLDEMVTWVDAETHNVVFGTRKQFLADRDAI